MPKYRKGSIINVKCQCGHKQQCFMKNITKRIPEGVCPFCNKNLRTAKILGTPKYPK